jgi:predicted transcriptional regulator
VINDCRKPGAGVFCNTPYDRRRRSKEHHMARTTKARSADAVEAAGTEGTANTAGGADRNAGAAKKPALSDPITLRVPQDILDDIEKIAETADRSRSWVIVRALKYYLINEGNDILQIRTGEEQIARGESIDAEEFFADLLGEGKSDAA